MIRLLTTALSLAVLAASVTEAQEPGRGRGRRGGPPGEMALTGQRAARQAIARLIRTQVQPNENQMRQLQAIDARFEPQRVALIREEMSVRQQLRQAMLDTANVDETKIGQLLDRMVTFPGRRAAMMEAEQKELAAVLSPLQRAKYHAIQEQVRRRIEQGRGRPAGGARPPA